MGLNAKINLFGAFPQVVVRVVSNVSGFIGVSKPPDAGLPRGGQGGLVR